MSAIPSNPDTDMDIQTKSAFSIFRGSDAPDLNESRAITYSNLGEDMVQALGRIQDASRGDGAKTSYLFGGGGMSLVHVWFKSGFPVVLHAHDADCLYYITAGSIHLGTETLAAGDGFFVPTDVPYTYTAGPEGVELLEFRTSETFDLRFASRNPKYYDRLVATIFSNQPKWASEKPPSAR